MKVKRILARLGKALLLESEEEVIQFARGWIEGKMKKVSPNQLLQAIETGTDIWDTSPSRYRRFGLTLAKKHRYLWEKYGKMITAENILKWMGQDMPSHASLIINYPDGKGTRWLEGQVDKVKIRLFEQGEKESMV